MLATVDRGDVGALVLLVMSASIDTIDQSITVDALRQRFIARDMPRSTGSTPTIRRSPTRIVIVVATDSSYVSDLCIRARRGSVLGPRSFAAYGEDVTDVFEQRRAHHHASVS